MNIHDKTKAPTEESFLQLLVATTSKSIFNICWDQSLQPKLQRWSVKPRTPTDVVNSNAIWIAWSSVPNIGLWRVGLSNLWSPCFPKYRMICHQICKYHNTTRLVAVNTSRERSWYWPIPKYLNVKTTTSESQNESWQHFKFPQTSLKICKCSRMRFPKIIKAKLPWKGFPKNMQGSFSKHAALQARSHPPTQHA